MTGIYKFLFHRAFVKVYHLLYTELGQSISFGNYWRDTAPIARADYLKSDNFLPVIDNDPESEHAPLFAGTAAQRKANFMNLNGSYYSLSISRNILCYC